MKASPHSGHGEASEFYAVLPAHKALLTYLCQQQTCCAGPAPRDRFMGHFNICLTSVWELSHPVLPKTSQGGLLQQAAGVTALESQLMSQCRRMQ